MDEKEALAINKKRYMFGNFDANVENEKRAVSSNSVKEVEDTIEAEFEELLDITSSALKDIEDGPDIPDSDLE